MGSVKWLMFRDNPVYMVPNFQSPLLIGICHPQHVQICSYIHKISITVDDIGMLDVSCV